MRGKVGGGDWCRAGGNQRSRTGSMGGGCKGRVAGAEGTTGREGGKGWRRLREG